MFDIDSDVKLKPNYKQTRISGEFFRSGCSVAPAHPPKVREGKRGKARHAPHAAAVPVLSDPMPLHVRRAPRIVRAAMRSVRATPAKPKSDVTALIDAILDVEATENAD